MKLGIPAALAAIALAASIPGGAQAAVVLYNTVPAAATYVPQQAQPNASPGTYGVELRGGRAGAADWEIGAGRGTSQSGNFNQGEFNWGSYPGSHSFTLVWRAVGVSINIDGTTVSSTLAPLVGNTLRVFSNREATVTFTSVDGFAPGAAGTVDGNGPAPNTAFFVTDDNWGGDGLTVTGTVDILGGGGSANLVLFSVGTMTLPVPEPATLALLGVGLAGLGVAARRRRRAA
ncbi:PEP-CTERM sorting domain-containing protein [Elioraea sp.]|uniref:PEP-CTERM sorting domain-containing protein n=1 Tax=Elioraea sp. TaxID=2185103 RepID=UPI0025C5852C|nr:PEP-CTERM sorting domain-containing protein [Elioraea sp.]